MDLQPGNHRWNACKRAYRGSGDVRPELIALNAALGSPASLS